MKFMDENQSWNLLQQKVFINGQDCPPELEDIGKVIARGCRELPLAVVLVVGILPTIAKTRASWKEIVENVISVVDGQMEKILSLSYTHLPHHLRAYFLYTGEFPELRDSCPEAHQTIETLLEKSRVAASMISYVGSLPRQLFELIHLRYLALGTLDDIPAAISTLLNLQTLIINPRLKKLSLVDNLFSWNDIHVIGSLPHHQVLKLRAFPNYYSQLQTWKTTDGEFPQLKFLQIHDSCLEHWITESSHFPRFKCLILRYCWSLLAISDGIEDIPTLELINMSHTSKSLADSAKQIQLEQQ
ncbi:hypothetical protein ACS0TY_023172 [Phlomoides rotata]